VVIDTFTVADSRINVGGTASFTVGGYYAYDGGAWSGSYSLNDTATKSVVGKYGYRITSITDSNYGLTVFEQTVPDIYVIFDKITITLSVADNRIDVDSAANWSYTATYQYDGADATPYVSLTLNDTLTKNAVGKYGYTVSSISETQYGLTAFSSNSFYIIFDNVQFTIIVVDSRINVGETAQLTVSGTYAYDGSAFQGTYSLNDTTTKNTVGKFGFKVSSMTETAYGLTVFETNEVYVIWDRVQITLSVADDRINVGDTAEYSFVAIYEYDDVDATPYVTVTLSDTLTKSSVGRYGYTVQSITKSQYGLTAFTSNSFYVIFDKLP